MKRFFDEDFLRKLEALSLISRRASLGQAKGERRSLKKGSGVEFRDFRPYVPGDDIRYVDWNIYSRLDRLILKLFVEEEDLCLHLLIDSSGSMGFGTPSKLEYALKVAAALGYIGLSHFERVAIGLFSDGLGKLLRPRRGRGQIFPLLGFLAKVRPQGRTDLSSSLKEYALWAKAPGLAILISDLLDPGGYQEGIMALLKRRLEVFLFHLVSTEELHPPFSGDLRLIDAELKEAKEVTVGPALLSRYRQNLEAFFQGVEALCLRNQVGYVRASTAVPFEDLVLRHLRQGGLLR